MIKKCVLALCIGVCVTVWHAQHNPDIQQRIGATILRAMEKTFNCTMEGRVSHLNIATLSIDFEHVHTTALNKRWSWYAQKLCISCSWIDLLVHRVLGLSVGVISPRTHSTIDYASIGIWEFIDKLRGNSPFSVPITLKSLHIDHGHVSLYNERENVHISHIVHGKIKKMGNYFKSVFRAHDLTITHRNKTLLHKGTGNITFQADPSTADKTVYAVDLQYALPTGAHDICTLEARWNGSCGAITAKSTDNSWHIAGDPITFHQENVQAHLSTRIPSTVITNIIPISYLTHTKGVISLNGNLTAFPFSFEGSLSVHDLVHGEKPLTHHIATTIKTDGTLYQGTVACSATSLSSLLAQGTWHYSRADRTGEIKMHNEEDFSRILPHNIPISLNDAHLTMHIDNSTLSAHIDAKGTLHPHESDHHISADLQLSNGALTLNGMLDTLKMEGAASYDTHFVPHFFNIGDHEKPFFTITREQPGIFHSTLDMKKCSYIWKHMVPFSLQTEGTLTLSGLLHNNSLYGHISLHNGTVRVPAIHNVIKNIHTRFVIHPHKKMASLHNMKCDFHRGSVTCERGTLWWNEQGILRYVHIPLLMNNCFINATKDFFAILSGYVVASWHTDKKPHVQGSVFLDKAQLKYNIFSSELSRHLAAKIPHVPTSTLDITSDLMVHSKDPIRIKTTFLETNAQIALHVTGSLKKPQLIGSIELLSGEFMFPYKPLFISKGSILFSRHTDDPSINIHAKNTIKQYHVHVYVTGSIASPHVIIESSPHLTEEQILALLLAGSEEYSLSFVVPALIAHNLKNLLFSTDQTFPAIERYMFKFLKPLRYIHVLPNYNDQTGRGGLRGALEIEVSDRLRAYMQKNFSLTEDVRFELEYTLSDDIRAKGIRDEHGDMGAEIEMRWKF